jgi:hypothetical protein
LIEGNATSGIQCNTNSCDPQISNCTIQDNGDYAVRTFADNIKDITGTMSITGNTNNAIHVSGDNVLTGTWLNHGVPYVIGGNVIVNTGETLTINPGCEVRFDGNYKMEADGVLVADGNPDNHIVFTSNLSTANPGDWRYLQFHDPEAGCLLNYCDISYGGSSAGSIYGNGTGTNLAISNCVIEESGSAGIYLYNNTSVSISTSTIQNNNAAGIYSNSATADAQVSGCIIQGNQYGYAGISSLEFTNTSIINNAGYGVNLSGAASPMFGASLTEWNDIYGNGTYDFYNGSADVYAYYVHWGTTDMATIASRIFDDNDNAALGIVYYMPWTNAAHDSLFGMAPPLIDSIVVVSDSVRIEWQPAAAADSYKMYSSADAYADYQHDISGVFTGTVWKAPLSVDPRFYEVTALFQA